MDRKDHIIFILQQQRDEALNKMVTLYADAAEKMAAKDAKIAELTKQLAQQLGTDSSGEGK